MSAREYATELGLHPNFFASIKKSCPARYKYITGLSSNLTEAYRKYINEQENYKSHLTDIYYELADKRKITSFSKYLHEQGYYANWNGFSTSINYSLFRTGGGLGNHAFFVKAPKIIAEYEKVKDEL